MTCVSHSHITILACLAVAEPSSGLRVSAVLLPSHSRPSPSIGMSAVANPESGLDADERIAIVNEINNEVTGSARRAEMVSFAELARQKQASL